MRPVIEVRAAQPTDLSVLAELCLGARQESAVGSQVCTSDPVTLSHQIGALTSAPGGTVLVAEADGAIVGMLLGRLLGPSPFTSEASLAVEALYVAPEHRRKGAGHALMLGATDLAAGAGADQVYAAPIPGARGMQRFFVRLGFAPVANHRVTKTSALQRRLAGDGAAVRRPGGLEDLIARRRQSRGAPVASVEDGTTQKDQAVRRSITRQVRRAVHTRLEVESSTTIS